MNNRAYGICPRQVKQPYGVDRAKDTRRACSVHSGPARGVDKTSSTSQEPSRDSR
ncbi:hypothetical protein H180DRAFT_04154 [Streptomyces sp. WMMB 322]|nr:hypothetical protein H180DRAFT_04154 [Streptomyces sp. WMMB 322]